MKIYKYHTININLLHSLRKGTNWYSKLHLLNDPFECFLMDNTKTDVFKNWIPTLSVCCFSKNNNNILMWSHYANDHKGVCLEFDVPDDDKDLKKDLIEVVYNNELTVIDNIKRDEKGHVKIRMDTDGKFLKTKFKHWEYEEELRKYIKCKEENKSGKEEYYIGNLTAIYFGKNTSNDDIGLVKHNSKHINSLNYYQVDLDTSTMKMGIIKKI